MEDKKKEMMAQLHQTMSIERNRTKIAIESIENNRTQSNNRGSIVERNRIAIESKILGKIRFCSISFDCIGICSIGFEFSRLIASSVMLVVHRQCLCSGGFYPLHRVYRHSFGSQYSKIVKYGTCAIHILRIINMIGRA